MPDSFSNIRKPRIKTILHMDGDAFFVGVEVAKNPKLKGKPVVSGEERGIVSALSYEAKALGVVRGMPIFRVKKDFPSVIVLPGDYASYDRYSTMMFDIVRRYADDVEEYSIDECFADLTGLEPPLKMTYLQIAERIKREINKELNLSISIGLAPTKVLAKVASKWVKPNGLTVITSKSAPDFLAQTPVEKIWGIGPQTATLLNKKGVKTALDFINKDLNWIRHTLSAPYEMIWQELRGVSVMAIDPIAKTVYSSIQKTRSFHPSTNDKTFLLSQLSKNIEEACAKARHFKLVPRKFSIFLKDKNFKFTTTSITLPAPTNAPEVLIALAHKEFKKMQPCEAERSSHDGNRAIPIAERSSHDGNRAIPIAERSSHDGTLRTLYRTTGAILHELVADSVTQGDLFGERNLADKFETIHKQLDSLENKFGKKVVYLASTHKALKRKKLGTEPEDIDRNLLFL